MKFSLNVRISGVIEAGSKEQAINIFRQGYDLAYVVDMVKVKELSSRNKMKSLNAVLIAKRKNKT